ncbi:hypothetical protein K438DRAFT_1994963 [Mycena galopus ATCC 62051]|nr:hypothetical protein K438DRAFT_1994963 [Mycena galopus ATCC 62051]
MPPIRRSASEGAHPDAYPNLQILKHNGDLKRQQREASNLTTVVLRDGITRLATFPYPLTSSGNPVAPSRLSKTIRAAHSPIPTCFCNKPAKYANPIINGEFTGKHAFACKERECSYWVVVDDLLAGTNGLLEHQHYPPRGSRKLPPSTYLTILPRDPTTIEHTFSERQSSPVIPVLPSSSTPSSSPISPSTPAASAAGSSSSDGWSGVRRLLNYRYDPEPDPFAFGIPTSVMDFTGTPIKKESPSPSLLMAQLDKSCAADSPSSSSSSGGLGPMYGAKYSYVHHNIPLPTHPLPGDSTALNLWSPPSPSRLVPPPKSTVAPAVQLSPEVELLTSSTGLGVDKFWALWEYCPVCHTIISKHLMPYHVCDLTTSDD